MVIIGFNYPIIETRSGGHVLTSADIGTGILSGQSFTISNAADWTYWVTNEAGPSNTWTTDGTTGYTAGFITTRAITRRIRSPSLTCSFSINITTLSVGLFIGFTNFNSAITSFDTTDPLNSLSGVGLAMKTAGGGMPNFVVATNGGIDSTKFFDFPEPMLADFEAHQVQIRAAEDNDGFDVELITFNIDPTIPATTQTLRLSGDTPDGTTDLKACMFMEAQIANTRDLNIYKWEGLF